MITLYETFYGYKGDEIDERGNVTINVNCDNVKSVVDEIELLRTTEKNKKRGFLKRLIFEINCTEFFIYHTEDRKYTLTFRFTDKTGFPVQNKEYDNISEVLKRMITLLEKYYL